MVRRRRCRGENLAWTVKMNKKREPGGYRALERACRFVHVRPLLLPLSVHNHSNPPVFVGLHVAEKVPNNTDNRGSGFALAPDSNNPQTKHVRDSKCLELLLLS